jgi:hypothetical protein
MGISSIGLRVMRFARMGQKKREDGRTTSQNERKPNDARISQPGASG